MSDIVFIGLMLGVGAAILGFCFCGYAFTKCIFNFKELDPSKINQTISRESEGTTEVKISQNKIVTNPMYIIEDPINLE